MNQKKKIILGVSLAVLIVGGSVTGGVLYHQEQVKAEQQQALVQQKKAKKLAAEKEDSKRNMTATAAVVALFGSKDFQLLADTYTDERLQNAKQMVANLTNDAAQKELTEKITQASTLAAQVKATTKRVQGLFQNPKKEALAAGIKQETITSVKQDITKKTPQKAAQASLTKDVNKASALYQQQVAAKEKAKQQAKQVAGNSNGSTANAAEANGSTNKPSKAAGERAKDTSGSSTTGGGNADTSTNTESSGAASSSKSSGSASTSKNEQSATASSPSQSSGKKASSGQSATANQPVVAKMNLASRTNQIITVVASGSSANVKFWEKSNGSWKQVFNVNGRVGSQGVGAADENHSRTPRGAYSLGHAFGTSNPGTSLSFRQITNRSYWISNVNDPQYNTWQERSSSNRADEHMASYPTQYRYGVVINYNTARTPGAGSGFFLHCSNGAATAGCVAIPTENMRTVLQKLNGGAYIVNVTSESELLNY